MLRVFISHEQRSYQATQSSETKWCISRPKNSGNRKFRLGAQVVLENTHFKHI